MATLAELRVFYGIMLASGGFLVAHAQPAPSGADTSVAEGGRMSMPTTAPTVTTNPIVAAPGAAKPNVTPPPPAPRRARAISADVAAQLSAAAPKFEPLPPKPAPKPEEEEEVDMRDIDKPRNGIIRLPRYIVREPAPPVLSERAVNTKRGLTDVAMKRYMTEGYRVLNRFTLPLFGSSAESYAMTRYEEDERLRNLSDMKDAAGLVSARDKSDGAYVRKQVNETFARPGDFDWKPIGR